MQESFTEKPFCQRFFFDWLLQNVASTDNAKSRACKTWAYFMAEQSVLGFIGAPANRAAPQRADPQWIVNKMADRESLAVVFVGDRPAIRVNPAPATIDFARLSLHIGTGSVIEPVLLHLDDDDRAVFAVQLDESAENQITSDDVKLIDLRSLAMQAVLPPASLGALAQARSLLGWHSTHRFCAKCGDRTQAADAGYRRDCSGCGTQHFPRVDPVVIMLIQHGDRFLMGRGNNFAENHFSALAGFMEPGETIEAATRRETFEETGIEVGDVRYLLSQPWPFPSTLMIGVIGEALTTDLILDRHEIAEAKWFSRAEISQMLDGTHPDGTSLPPPMSIAYQMLKQYLD